MSVHRPILPLVTAGTLILAGPSLAAWSTDVTVDNIVVDATGDQRNSVAIADGAGGFYAAWEDTRSGRRIYVQRMSAEGVAMWVDDGILAGDGGANQFAPDLALDGAGGVIVVWDDRRVSTGVYGQRLDADGAKLWAADGLEICNEFSYQAAPSIVTDPAGGAYVAWNDYRRSNEDIYGQHVDLDGNRLWAHEGSPIFASSRPERNVVMTDDGAGGVIYVTSDIGTNVLHRHLSVPGGFSATSAFSTEPINYPSVRIAGDGAGGVFVAWSSTWNDLKIQHLDALGSPQWNGGADLEINPLSNSKFGHAVAHDGSGGAYVAFADTYSGSWVIALAHVNAAGSPSWGDTGVAVGPRIASVGAAIRCDTAGHALVGWAEPNQAKFMMQKFDLSGTEQWEPGGVAISHNGAGAYGAPHVLGTNDDATIMVMERPISAVDVNIHAKKITADGILGELLAVGPGVSPAHPVVPYPNPFQASVRLTMPSGGGALAVFDAAGRRVRRILPGAEQASIVWDGRTDGGQPVPPGVYLVRPEGSPSSPATRLVRIR